MQTARLRTAAGLIFTATFAAVVLAFCVMATSAQAWPRDYLRDWRIHNQTVKPLPLPQIRKPYPFPLSQRRPFVRLGVKRYQPVLGRGYGIAYGKANPFAR